MDSLYYLFLGGTTCGQGVTRESSGDQGIFLLVYSMYGCAGAVEEEQ